MKNVNEFLNESEIFLVAKNRFGDTYLVKSFKSKEDADKDGWDNPNYKELKPEYQKINDDGLRLSLSKVKPSKKL